MTQHAFKIKLAERIVEIHPLFPYMAEFCKDYLMQESEDLPEAVTASFGINDAVAASSDAIEGATASSGANDTVTASSGASGANPTPDFIVETTPEDITFEREKSAREDALEGVPTRHFPDDYLETLAIYRKIAVKMTVYDTILFHGSALALDGEGYLFSARSGMGKSTHARLWRNQFGDRVTIVNDDKPLLRVTDAGVIVCGTPWDGKHRLSTNTAVPLKGICFLERDVTNHIEPVKPEKAYPLLLQQTYRPEEPAALVRTLRLVDRLAASTGLYALGCNMEPEAAYVSYYGMHKGLPAQ